MGPVESTSPVKPLFVYDGDCGFCRRWVARWRGVTRDRIEYAPYQEVSARLPDIGVEAFAQAVHLVEPDGRHSRGAEAVFRALAYAPGHSAWLGLYERLPGFAALSEWAYAVIARHRPFLSRVTGWLWGPHLVPPGERIVVWIFIRAIAAIYCIAFVSLWIQIQGLIGSGGILPARDTLAALGTIYGKARYASAPTLCWISAGDGFLHALCGGGVALSIALFLGFAPALCLILLWVSYLSLATVTPIFLWFQWDSLLLETGFLAALLAPWRLWSRPWSDPAPSRGALFLGRWLLFRLLFASAAVKLGSGDPTWRDLTALTYHFETQPLPPWTAWYAHHLPSELLRACAAAVLSVEGLVPFLFLGPRRIRLAAAALVILLQGIIAATGNYGFFNALTVALCLLLLDDGVWPERLRARIGGASARGGWPVWVRRPLFFVLFLLSLVPLLGAVRGPLRWLGPVPRVYQRVSAFRTVNEYGLFAVMTVERPEIILEGSSDGVRWIPYEFHWKPGDVKRRPAFVAPHQPRLDWQMWFAALSDYRREVWFLSFCARLLQDSPPVAGLLAKDPFRGKPPRYIRAVVFRYRFTDASVRHATGAWWRREPLGLYCPVLMLERGHLAAAPPELQHP